MRDRRRRGGGGVEPPPAYPSGVPTEHARLERHGIGVDFVPETGGGVDLIPRKGLDYGDEPVVRRALDAGDVYYLALLAGLVIDGEELLTLGLGDQLISFSSSLSYSFSSSAAAAVDVSLVAECRRLVIRDSIALVAL